jgi:hypothetical protein
MIRNMTNYFGRVDDHDQLRQAIKDRYGVGIMQTTDPANPGAAPMETYSKGAFSIAVDNGLVEGITLGFNKKIASALGTLFTEPGMRFDLTHDTVDDLTEETQLIEMNRQKGGFMPSIVEVDLQSCEVGSSCMLFQYLEDDDTINYTRFSPADLYAIFGDTIIDNGVPRATDVTDIEDASAVIINLGAVDVSRNRYLGIVGRSEGYPLGRWVTFTGSDGRQLPPDYDSNAIEYEIDGEQANPLSWFAEQNPELNTPEYPIVIIQGGITDSHDLTPITSSLYHNTLEIDLAASHILAGTQDGISGTIVVSREKIGAPHALPRVVSGAMALEPGQSADRLPSDSSGALTALETLERLMIHIASGYSVPDYMVVSRDHTLDASSGVALEIKARPLSKKRAYRAELNELAVNKIFQIEKALIGVHHEGDDSVVSTLLECDQTWDPGCIRLPENKVEQVQRLTGMLNAGVIDIIEYLRQTFTLSSDVEAMEIYDRMSDRAGEYPALNKEEKDEQEKQRTTRLGLQRNR